MSGGDPLEPTCLADLVADDRTDVDPASALKSLLDHVVFREGYVHNLILEF
jgi:hypothetical protein